MSDEKELETFKTLWGARVLWPADVADNTLADAVGKATEALQQY